MKNTNKSVAIATSGLFASLTAIGAYISIPTGFIPFTFQIFFVLLSGIVLGPKLGPLSQIIYIGIGTAGFPVFASGNAGPGVLFGPKGGYLIGFVVASFLTGIIYKKLISSNQKTRTFMATLAGITVIYIFGFINLLRFQPPKGALITGVIPFIPLDIIKAILVVLVVSKLPKFTMIN